MKAVLIKFNSNLKKEYFICITLINHNEKQKKDATKNVSGTSMQDVLGQVKEILP